MHFNTYYPQAKQTQKKKMPPTDETVTCKSQVVPAVLVVQACGVCKFYQRLKCKP